MRTITISTILGTISARQGNAIMVDGNRTSTLRNLCTDFARGFVSLASYRPAALAKRLLAGLSPQPAMCMSHCRQHEISWPVGVAVKRVSVGIG